VLQGDPDLAAPEHRQLREHLEDFLAHSGDPS
jgi:hypothetical protein